MSTQVSRNSDWIVCVISDGQLVAELSRTALLPTGVIIGNRQEVKKNHREFLQAHYPQVLADSLVTGLFVYIPPDVHITTPLHLRFLSTHQLDLTLQPQHYFILAENSSITVLEEHIDIFSQRRYINTINNIYAGKNAALDYYKIQHASARTIHFTNTFIQQKKNSRVQMNNFILASQYSRDDIAVKLQESQAECAARGFYFTNEDNQYVAHQVHIDHQAPACKSDMLYKGILKNKSRADFVGKVLVRTDAQKTEAHQANHHLLLSRDAQANAKPELEIYADDVRCKHGATVGELDKDALFYLCSRGVPRDEATQLLLGGFAAEVLQGMAHAGVAEYISGIVSPTDVDRSNL